jgi:hypothetical protein
MAFAAVNFKASKKASTPAVNFSTIDKAFAGDSSLKKRVYDAISTQAPKTKRKKERLNAN